MVTMGEPMHRAIQGTNLQPIRPPLPTNWGSQPSVKTCIANCGQTVPDTTVVCIDSLCEHTIVLPNSSISFTPRGTPSPKRGKSKNAEHRSRCRVYTFLLSLHDYYTVRRARRPRDTTPNGIIAAHCVSYKG